jgi:hypothetical protein
VRHPISRSTIAIGSNDTDEVARNTLIPLRSAGD